MNRELIERAKGTPLLHLIGKYGSWNVTNSTWTAKSWDFMKTLVHMHKDLKLSPLFTLRVQPDLRNSSRYIIMVLCYSSHFHILDQTQSAVEVITLHNVLQLCPLFPFQTLLNYSSYYLLHSENMRTVKYQNTH